MFPNGLRISSAWARLVATGFQSTLCRFYEDCETIFDFLRNVIFRENEFSPGTGVASAPSPQEHYSGNKSPRVMRSKVGMM